MECWNAEILGIKAEINHFNCKKLLSFNFVRDKLTHHSIIPIGPARSCPWPPLLAWPAGELAMAGGAKLLSSSLFV